MRYIKTLLAAVLVFSLAACGDEAAEPPTTQPTVGPGVTAPTVPEGWERAGIAEITGTELQLLESFPVQARLRVTGSLPTPCHVVAWEVSQEGNTVDVELFSAVDPEQVCAQVLEPFESVIPLGSFEPGDYVVQLNGEQVAEFSA